MIVSVDKDMAARSLGRIRQERNSGRTGCLLRHGKSRASSATRCAGHPTEHEDAYNEVGVKPEGRVGHGKVDYNIMNEVKEGRAPKMLPP